MHPNGNDTVCIFGISISNLSMQEAVEMIESLIRQESGPAHAIYLVNAHTLNLATDHPPYHAVLTSAHRVLGDGTGVRWAARQRKVAMKDNLVGTNLIPELFTATANRGYRYFLLGADNDTIARAAENCSTAFPGWELAGYSHGYLDSGETTKIIAQINAARPHLLLVGMGNPKQEEWIHLHGHELQVPVAIGVGGLFDHWAGNLTRAPAWVRNLGYEWLQLLIQQPHKWRRYLLGNPKFLLNMTRSARRDRLAGR
jgi:N-acetylglucosaminyldiphosphoundecaprenol N-acetyl-beta-D-mannosaminyltransferase